MSTLHQLVTLTQMLLLRKVPFYLGATFWLPGCSCPNFQTPPSGPGIPSARYCPFTLPLPAWDLQSTHRCACPSPVEKVILETKVEVACVVGCSAPFLCGSSLGRDPQSDCGVLLPSWVGVSCLLAGISSTGPGKGRKECGTLDPLLQRLEG